MLQIDAKVLIDPGSTHSFVFPQFTYKLFVKYEPLNYVLVVSTSWLQGEQESGI